MAVLTDQVGAFLAKKRRRSSATYEQYRFILERVLLPFCEAASLTEAASITDRQLDALTAHIEGRKREGKSVTVTTVRTYLRGVKIFLKWAKVPAGDFELPAEPERMRDVLSRKEIEAMENRAMEERDRLIVRVLADCGIRVGELLGLRQADLREDSHEHKYFIRVIGKRDREREVGIPKDVFKRLQHFARHGGERDYIFYGLRRTRGRAMRLTRSGVDKIIHHLALVAGIERRVWPHLFRHSYITHMARKKVPLQDVMKSVGHRTPAMTMKIYSHTTPEDSYDGLMEALKR